MEKLIAAHERTITGLSWCPSNTNLFATCGVDKRVVTWNAKYATEEQSLVLREYPSMIDWCPQNAGVIALLLDPGTPAVWHMGSPKGVVGINGISIGSCSCIRWNHGQSNARLALGLKDGGVWIWDMLSETVTKMDEVTLENDETAAPCVDIQWDPLSNDYIIASFKDSRMVLFDTNSKAVLMTFERQANGEGHARTSTVTRIDSHVHCPSLFLSVFSRCVCLHA